ncbi:MAG TPA: hypothetical protein VJP59_08345 [Gemmatimonadota bacterium]|nr:hypothetical protein [Gemmatimonadota bacterium]
MTVLSTLATMATACSEPVGVVAPGDPVDTSPRPSEMRRGPLLYRAILETAREDGVAARVEIVNEGSAPETLGFPDTCIAMLRAYFAPAGPEAWDQRDGKTMCRDRLREVQIAPGDTVVDEPRVVSIAVLGDGLPEGSYRFTTYLIPIGEPEIELPLGEVRLALP